MKQHMILALAGILLASCSSETPIQASGFPLQEGTTWVYSYQAYNPSPQDPEQTINATYDLTQTIVDTETVSNYVVAHVVREFKLVNADAAWTQELSSQPNEFWYVLDGQQLYQSNFRIDTSHINPEQLILDYQFPLSTTESWCLMPDSRSDIKETSGCDFVGRREVTGYGRYESQAGSFENCYDLTDVYNGGNILQTVCDGVGIVHMKFDHAGTRFGFEQTLVSFSTDTP